jgi:mRNA interferase MazF
VKLARGEVWLAKAAAPERTRAASNREVLEAALAARPVLVVSPPEFNDHLRTVIVVPISRDRASAPFRPAFRLDGERTVALVDQVRTIERSRLVRRVGKLSSITLRNVLETLRLAFEP